MPDSRRFLRVALVVLLFITASCARSHDATRTEANATPTTPSAARGEALFSANCASCHGIRGVAGRIGPSLRDERKRKSATEIRAAITDPEPPMPKLYPAQLTAQEVDDLTAYVETL